MPLFLTLIAAVCLLCSACAGQPLGGRGDDGEAAEASAELGYTDSETGAFIPLSDGDVMPLYAGLQGTTHFFVTLRAGGFPASAGGGAEIVLDQLVTLEAEERVLHDFEQTVPFLPADDGTVEVASRFVFLDAIAAEVDGSTARIEIILTSERNPQVHARVVRSVVLELQ